MPEQATIETRDMRTLDGEIRGFDPKTREINGIASTGAIDRYNEVVLPSAFEGRLPADPKGKIVFAASHTYVNLDGEPTILGTIEELQLRDEGLWFRAKFDEDELANKWIAKVQSGAIKGVSIGFRRLASEIRDVEVAPDVTKRILHYTAVDLLEISLTPIPANTEATVRQAQTEQLAVKVASILDRVNQIGEVVEKLSAQVTDGNNEILASLTPTELTELRVESVGGEGPKHNEQQEVVESLRRIKDELEGDKDA